MGRKKLTPDDLMKFEEEKKKRVELRKQIIEEVESKELTFKPQLSEKSIRLQVLTSPSSISCADIICFLSLRRSW